MIRSVRQPELASFHIIGDSLSVSSCRETSLTPSKLVTPSVTVCRSVRSPSPLSYCACSGKEIYRDASKCPVLATEHLSSLPTIGCDKAHLISHLTSMKFYSVFHVAWLTPKCCCNLWQTKNCAESIYKVQPLSEGVGVVRSMFPVDLRVCTQRVCVCTDKWHKPESLE